MLRRHTISMKNAFRGLIWALRTQPNYRIHIFLGSLSIFAGVILEISYYEFIIIIFLITIGLTIECVNTAFECTNDAVDRKIREDIRLAKDVAAGAMLMFSIGAAIIAGIIFIPRILSILAF